MNLPTVEVYIENNEGVPYAAVAVDGPENRQLVDQLGDGGGGTYALVRVADGQTITAEKMWWCDINERVAADQRPWIECDQSGKGCPECDGAPGLGHSGSAMFFVCPLCEAAIENKCGGVLLVRGAADE